MFSQFEIQSFVFLHKHDRLQTPLLIETCWNYDIDPNHQHFWFFLFCGCASSAPSVCRGHCQAEALTTWLGLPCNMDEILRKPPSWLPRTLSLCYLGGETDNRFRNAIANTSFNSMDEIRRKQPASQGLPALCCFLLLASSYSFWNKAQATLLWA